MDAQKCARYKMSTLMFGGLTVAFFVATIVLAVELSKAHAHHLKHDHLPKDKTANPAVVNSAAVAASLTTAPVKAVQGAMSSSSGVINSAMSSYFNRSTLPEPVAQVQPYRALGTEPYRMRQGANSEDLDAGRGPQGAPATPYRYRSQGANSEMVGMNRGPAQGANSELTGMNRGPAQGANTEMTGQNRGPAQGSPQGYNSEDLATNRLNLGLQALGTEASALADVYGAAFSKPGSTEENPKPKFSGTPHYASDVENSKQLLKDVYGSAYTMSNSDNSSDPLRATAAASVAKN